MNDWKIPDDFLGSFVCPFLGCLLASATFGAPVRDLRQALLRGSLGTLNPIPWAVMTGNCWGWCAYAYYTNDAFVLAANGPGLLLSLWLNQGAAKLQYRELCKSMILPSSSSGHPAASKVGYQGLNASRDFIPLQTGDPPGGEDADDTQEPPAVDADDVEDDDDMSEVPLPTSNSPDALIWTPQEVLLMRILLFWSAILLWVGWIAPMVDFHSISAAAMVGYTVNVNLVFFFGAPLQKLAQVIRSKNSSVIHIPTMIMTIANCFFWMAYGVARQDVLIIFPNATGFLLGICQGILCVLIPRRTSTATTMAGSSTNHQQEDGVFSDSDDLELSSYNVDKGGGGDDGRP